MGSSKSKSKPPSQDNAAMPPTPKSAFDQAQELDKSMRKEFGMPSSGGTYLVGLDVVTLPFAFATGCVIGVGIRLRRPRNHLRPWWREPVGAGLWLTGLTLACPPWLRILYLPFIGLTPGAVAWAGFIGAIIGAGARLSADPKLSADNPDEDEEAITPSLTRAALSGAVLGCGLYLVAPGFLRVAIQHGQPTKA